MDRSPGTRQRLLGGDAMIADNIQRIADLPCQINIGLLEFIEANFHASHPLLNLKLLSNGLKLFV